MNQPVQHSASVNRRALLDSFSALQQRFDETHASIKQKEDQVRGEVKRTTEALMRQPDEARGKFKDDHPVRELVDHWLEQTREVARCWRESVEQSKAGTEFRSRIGDRLLVYVYGKVNAGKSSLGNYIANGTSRIDSEVMGELRRERAKFFLHGASAPGEEVRKVPLKGGFGVDRQECTSAVQYFTLPGLGWVDSPGLHSKTPENGELAKSYAQAADLIVYVMNSANPGRDTDMQEIEQLLAMSKPVVFALTRADREEPDEVDGELVLRRVMMPESDQQQQVRYVSDTLRERFGDKLDQCEVLPLSVAYAEATGDEKTAGIAPFMQCLRERIESDSVRMKRDTPRHNLMHFCRELGGTSEKLEQSQQTLEQALKPLQEDVEYRRQALSAELKLVLHQQVDRAMQTFEGDTRSLAREVREGLIPVVQERVSSTLYEQLQQVDRAVAKGLIFTGAEGLPGFEHEYAERTYRDASKRRAIGGSSGGLLGGALGLLGGPIGAAVGAAAGAWAGERIGNALADTKTEHYLSGDNRDQIEQSAREAFGRDIDRAIQQLYVQPLSGALEVMQETVSESRAEMERFEAYLQSMIKEMQDAA
ncbi:GTPase domain-containing protein [Halomonas koreensis]|uniref:GTPase domain-containing protein n=1 Tax=Halomonas koreensis TaxID=245385 RepID=A0ABU1G5E5_9GAMM|nr:GTPase domain-containing protein [Halomonas koreensis]MDR5868162.1 GTPase domain-containing protein [Halomonas koreensis]